MLYLLENHRSFWITRLMARKGEEYLEHYYTGEDCKGGEHDIIDGGHYCCVECVKCLQHGKTYNYYFIEQIKE